jgi:hypothetical protein
MNSLPKNELEKNAILEYLTNPVYYNSVKKTNNKINNKNNKEDIRFYRKRIISLTKEMFKGVFANETLKKIYENYTNSIISHFKIIDTKDILQDEYKLINNENNHNLEDMNNDNSSMSNIEEYNTNTIEEANNNIMKKIVILPNLDNYVIKKKTKKENELVLPIKKDINLHCPTLKTKGLVKKDKNDKKDIIINI